MAAIFTNVFLAGFDGTVTAATYTLISSKMMHARLASWITTSYLVTSTAVQPLYGRFSDIYGRRACLLFATALFGLGCLGCSLSPDIASLIIARGVAGVGGGGLMTMCEFSLINPSTTLSKCSRKPDDMTKTIRVKERAEADPF
jgi:MFS family permease